MYHRAHKKIAHVDPETNLEIIPNKENGWKFELFIYSLLPRIDKGRFGVVTVDRAAEFAPVKNADGENGQLVADSPAMTRKMILDQHKKWLEGCENWGLRIDPATKGNIEVSFMLSYAGENLEALHEKHSTEVLTGTAGFINHEGEYMAQIDPNL